MLMSLKKDRSIRAQILPWSLSGEAKHHTLKRGFSQPKTSFFKPTDLKLFQEGKKKSPGQLFSSSQSQPPCHESPAGRHWVPLGLKYTAGVQS